VGTISVPFIVTLRHMHAHMTTSQKDASLLSRIIRSFRRQSCQKS